MEAPPSAPEVRAAKLLIASPDSVTLNLMGKYIADSDHRDKPTTVVKAKTLQEIHAALIEEPPPTSVWLDDHFEGVEVPPDQHPNYVDIRKELADCRERFLAVVLANGNGSRDVLAQVQREKEADPNPNALVKMSLLGNRNAMARLFSHMEAYRLNPPANGAKTMMNSILD